MSNNKQSSVEWLYFEMESFIHKSCRVHFVEYFEKAKAMHKSDIVWAHGIKMKGVNNHKCVSGEQYYNETFGGNNEQR